MPDRAAIERLVPHAGSMCLLESVSEWDDLHIECMAPAPDALHPLAREGHVPAIVACEYAAQAAAVHGALLDNASTPREGMLVKVTDLLLHCGVFPEHPLDVHAAILGRVTGGCLYLFRVRSNSTELASGRLMIAFTKSVTP